MTVLSRVWQDDAYLGPALYAELDHHPQLSLEDRRLATALCFGVIRTEVALVQTLDEFAHNEQYKRDFHTLGHLLVAAFSILFLDRVPPFAAVNEAVKAIKAGRHPQQSGFANAVLRNIVRKLEAKGRPALEAAVMASVPKWLRKRLSKAVGKEAVAAWLATGNAPAAGLCVRVPEARHGIIDRLREARPGGIFEPSIYSPLSVVARRGGDLATLPGFGTEWFVQEEGAHVIALAAGVVAGKTVLDACAGRGGKGAVFVAMGAEAVDVADRYPAKLRQADEVHAGRFRASYAVDWEQGVGDVPGEYDLAFVDAPCSGVGTIGRRPEILRRLQRTDIARLADLQVAIVGRVASRVKFGGLLVYAVCSVLPEEGAEVVARIQDEAFCERYGVRLRAVPIQPAASAAEVVGALDDGVMLVDPSRAAMDGYFVASFVVEKV